MANILNEIRNRHDLFYKIVLFLTCISIIVYLFPKEATFKYEFQKGRAWQYPSYFAPFEFSILKSEEEIKVDREEAL